MQSLHATCTKISTVFSIYIPALRSVYTKHGFGTNLPYGTRIVYPRGVVLDGKKIEMFLIF
jgi:hypothetical protein